MNSGRRSLPGELLKECVEFSRKIGVQPDVVLHGGGNTSVKTEETDHTGKSVKVLRVKGSGSDLSTIDENGFTALRQDDLLAAKKIREMTDIEMADYLKKSMLDPSQPSPSVETFMHAFIPNRFVLHSHADNILALTNTDLSDSQLMEMFPGTVIVPYHQPGFKLARAFMDLVENLPSGTRGIILRKHGLFTFGETGLESYEKHMELINEAGKILKEKCGDLRMNPTMPVADRNLVMSAVPGLRGKLSSISRKVLLIDSGEEASIISRTKEAEMLWNAGPATPDMLIRTKYDYLYVPSIGEIDSLIDQYVRKYTQEYEMYVGGKYPMHDPYPSIIVIRGFGVITAATTWKECRIIMDQFLHSFRVNVASSTIGGHSFISREASFEMEYWPLEEAKLKKFVPKPLQGKISLVTGAANGIGYVAARTLAANGSLVFALDLSPQVEESASRIEKETGSRVIGIRCDISSEEDVRKAFQTVIGMSGGIDILFNNAGILKSAPLTDISAEELDRHYRVNARGTFLVTREAFTIMKESGLGGNIVFNITKNLLHPGPEMLSYGSTKAMAAQMCHYVAKEGGKYGIRANIINPDKVFRGSLIWEGGVLESRAKAKGQTVEAYKTTNLLRREVLPEHVANVLLALVNEEIFGATTDAMIPVDGGVL
jgi:rhamnose utilization protein RhaD (predicted bifunctional aldolase and dehydrogenase)/NAD(P)-dependent dehydrogenase (short-subunit alcohol dehydrogenase family)